MKALNTFHAPFYSQSMVVQAIANVASANIGDELIHDSVRLLATVDSLVMFTNDTRVTASTGHFIAANTPYDFTRPNGTTKISVVAVGSVAGTLYISELNMRSMGVGKKTTPSGPPELVLNGDFSNGLTSWNQASVQSSSVVNGELITSGVASGANQAFTTEVGKSYRATALCRKITADMYLQLGTTPNGFGYGYVFTASITPVTLTVDFTATTTNTYISLIGSGGGADNASVKLLV